MRKIITTPNNLISTHAQYFAEVLFCWNKRIPIAFCELTLLDGASLNRKRPLASDTETIRRVCVNQINGLRRERLQNAQRISLDDSVYIHASVLGLFWGSVTRRVSAENACYVCFN